MIGSISIAYAVRSLLRHPRRTLLSVVGVGIGCGIGIIAAAWIRGAAEMQIRAASESGVGHIQIVPKTWPARRENTLRLPRPDQILTVVRSLPDVRATAMRARSSALLAFGNRAVGVEIAGVQPDAERASNRIVFRSAVTGRYLRPDDTGCAVIGKALARRLRVRLDDDLLVTLAGRREIRSAMLRIVGILETGSRELDAGICHVTLRDIAELTGYEGPAELAVLLKDYRRIDDTQRLLADKLAHTDAAVVTWREVNRELAANVEGDTAFTRMLVMIIIVVVALGITSAQLTAVLERRREFAVLAALGMKGRYVVGVLVAEAVLIGLGGALAALALGTPLAYYLATEGVDFSSMMGGETAICNVLLDPVMYASVGPWIFGYAAAVSLLATLAASVYPAWFAVRTDPAGALREI
ncbi:MAG: ABC transporter permease [Kiritimatiellae bacterium]|nr:ABC transporter permease [Kiritimatiellia bacterium]